MDSFDERQQPRREWSQWQRWLLTSWINSGKTWKHDRNTTWPKGTVNETLTPNSGTNPPYPTDTKWTVTAMQSSGQLKHISSHLKVTAVQQATTTYQRKKWTMIRRIHSSSSHRLHRWAKRRCTMKFLRHILWEVEMECETRGTVCPAIPIARAFLQFDRTWDRHAFIRSANKRQFTINDKKHSIQSRHERRGKILSKKTGIHRILLECDVCDTVRQHPPRQRAEQKPIQREIVITTNTIGSFKIPQVRWNTAKAPGIDGLMDVKKTVSDDCEQSTNENTEKRRPQDCE